MVTVGGSAAKRLALSLSADRVAVTTGVMYPAEVPLTGTTRPQFALRHTGCRRNRWWASSQLDPQRVQLTFHFSGWLLVR